jgi:hypothetical protein
MTQPHNTYKVMAAPNQAVRRRFYEEKIRHLHYIDKTTTYFIETDEKATEGPSSHIVQDSAAIAGKSPLTAPRVTSTLVGVTSNQER